MERQGIASMLAFDGERYLGQLYLQEYDLQFRRERYPDATDEEPGPLKVMLLTASADSGLM